MDRLLPQPGGFEGGSPRLEIPVGNGFSVAQGDQGNDTGRDGQRPQPVLYWGRCTSWSRFAATPTGRQGCSARSDSEHRRPARPRSGQRAGSRPTRRGCCRTTPTAPVSPPLPKPAFGGARTRSTHRSLERGSDPRPRGDIDESKDGRGYETQRRADDYKRPLLCVGARRLPQSPTRGERPRSGARRTHGRAVHLALAALWRNSGPNVLEQAFRVSA